ncbi:MAG: Ig-like domain-containing protein [Phycisphaerales bacterium]|nr:Ig-like domain-containing protein [Phycisphaerales bacterium]
MPLTFDIASSNPTVLPTNNIAIIQNGEQITLRLTPVSNLWGNATITLAITEGSATVGDTFDVTVLPLNDAPTLTSLDDLFLNEDEGVSRTVLLRGISTGARNEEEELIVSVASSDPAFFSLLRVTYTSPEPAGSLELRAAPDAFGTALVTVSVSDGQSTNNLTTQTFSVAVAPINDPPTLASLSEMSIPEDAPAQTVPLTGISFGPANELQTLIVSASSSNPSLIPNPTVIYQSPQAEGILQFQPTQDAFGSTVISVTVDDGGQSNNVVTRLFQVTVFPINEAPSLDPISNITTNEDAGLIIVPLTGIAAGAADEPDFLTVTAVSLNPELITGAVLYTNPASTGVLQLLTVSNATGVATIDVTVQDGAPSNNIIVRSFTVTLAPVNDPPVISGLADVVVAEDTTLPIAFTISDAETSASNLTVSVVSSNITLLPPGGIALGGDGGNRSLTLTPAANLSGVSAVTVFVSDGEAQSAQTFVVTVRRINGLPVLSQVNDVTIAEDSVAGPIEFSVADRETPPDTLLVSVMSSNPALVRHSGLQLTKSGALYSLLIRPETNGVGQALITVAAIDGEGGTGQRTFALNVTPVNDPPFLSPPPDRTVSQDTEILAPFVVTDPDTALIDVATTAASSNASLVPSNNFAVLGTSETRTLRITPASGQTGTATIFLTARNPSGGEATVSFNLLVQPATNVQPPIILTQPVSQTVSNGALVSFTVAAGGAAPLSYQWMFQGSDIPGAINPAYQILSATMAHAGSYSVRVSNSAGTVTSASAILTVMGGSSITISITDQTTLEDTPLTIPFTVLLPNPGSMVLTATSTNASLVSGTNLFFSGSGSSRFLTVVPSANAFGVTLITVTAMSEPSSTSDNFLLTVVPVNDVPTLTPIPNFGALRNSGEQVITLSGISSGAANESQALSVTATSSDTAIVSPVIDYASASSTGTLRFTPNQRTGIAVVTVTVNDGGGSNNVVSRSFTVFQRAANNSPPTISAINDLTISEDTSTPAIPFTISDSETPLSSLAVSAVSSNPSLVPPGGIVFSGAVGSREVTVTPAPNQTGSALITITVNDTQSGMATETFMLTVQQVNDPPSLAAISNQTMPEDSVLALPLGIADADTHPSILSVMASSSDTTLVPPSSLAVFGNYTNRTLLISPPANQAGTAVITVTVQDNTGGSAQRTFNLTVTGGNDAPAIADISSVAIDEDSPLTEITAVISDAETAAESLTLSLTSSNPALAAISLGGAGANRIISIQPSPNAFGMATIVLTVTDAQGALGSDAFVLTINPVNDPPAIDAIGDLTLLRDVPSQTVPLTGISFGPANENQALAVSATSSNPDLLPPPLVSYLSPASSGLLTLQPKAETNGIAVVTVLVNDGETIVSRSFSVTIQGVSPPELQVQRVGDALVISVLTFAGQVYTLEFKNSLNDPSWTAAGASVAGTGDFVNFIEDASASSSRFYRVRVQ